MIFFHDKHWYRSEPLFSIEEEEEEEEEEENLDERVLSLAPSQLSVTSTPPSTSHRRTECDFLLFNYLLRFVHREGKIGEFSRAGLLFLVDVAMSPGEQRQPSEGAKSESEDMMSTDPITDAALTLAEYILYGDFSEVLGAGLSAAYSLLPSKIEFSRGLEGNGNGNNMTIGPIGQLVQEEIEKLELEKKERNRVLGIENADDPDFKQRLNHFLKLMEFLQDVLKRNTKDNDIDLSAPAGTAIVHSILDAVRRIFLENVLYPSILECSDSDGSAVAVLSYIEIMLRTLHDGPLSDLIITFLVNENDEPRVSSRSQALLNLDQPPCPQLVNHSAKYKRRKSSAMALLEMEVPDARKPTEYFTTTRFTLKDLLMSNLCSKSQATATTALQLIQTLTLRFPQLIAERIFTVVHDSYVTNFPRPAPFHASSVNGSTEDEPLCYPDTEKSYSPPSHYEEVTFTRHLTTTYYIHEQEMNLYMNLISRVVPSHSGDVFSTGYDYYLHDALLAIQNQLGFSTEGILAENLRMRRQRKHRLNLNDPILSRILDSLRSFFLNTPDYNIALTGFLAKLALDPDRSLTGWLTLSLDDSRSEHTQNADPARNGDDDRSIDFKIGESLVYETNVLPAASMDENFRPVVYSIYQGLVNQLEHYRQIVDEFDRFLMERRQGLLFSENLTDALGLTLDVPCENTLPLNSTSTKSKTKTKAAFSFASFLTPKRNKSFLVPTGDQELSSSVPSRDTGGSRVVSGNPFGSHYQKTGTIQVQPLVVPAPSVGPWIPIKVPKWNSEEEEDVFSSGWTERPSASGHNGAFDSWEKGISDGNENESQVEKTITLSLLLDNVVILEESIKELAATIHARRSLGIDSIRYL